MKPLFEKIDISERWESFHFFRIETQAFEPFWHYHPELELTLIEKGSGTRFIGDSILPFGDLDLVLIGPNLPHHWVSIGSSGNSNQNAFVFQFTSSLFSEVPECYHFEKLYESAKLGLHFFNPNRDVIKMIKGFEHLSKVEQVSKLILILNKLSQDRNTSSLSTKAPSFSPTNSATSRQHKISKTTRYIIEHLDKNLTVQHMADMTHMVPQSFCRWFKMHSGHSFITFLNKTRIESACHHLLTTNLSIQDIAYACGFESISHFNRTFKKLKGLSPSNYKKLDFQNTSVKSKGDNSE